MVKILDDLSAGKKPAPVRPFCISFKPCLIHYPCYVQGPQSSRKSSEPKEKLTSLTEKVSLVEHLSCDNS